MRFAIVLPVPVWALQRYAATELPAAHPLLRALYCDPGGRAFAQLGVFNFRFDSRSTFDSPHAKTTVWQATWRGFLLGVQTGMQGDPRQQGGAFVIRGGACAWAHLDRHNADQVPIPVLVRAAGAPDAAYRHRALRGGGGGGGGERAAAGAGLPIARDEADGAAIEARASPEAPHPADASPA